MLKKIFLILIVIALLVFGVAYVALEGSEDLGKTAVQISVEEATAQLEKMLKKVEVQELDARKASVQLGGNSLADELPDISQNPLVIEGKGDIDVEIFSSPEKAGTGMDGWLVDIAKQFNNQNNMINGKTVSVSLRSISSGLGADYIISGKYWPDAFTPSNEFWGKMIEANNVDIILKEARLVGNVAGILMEKQKQEAFIKTYGTVNMQTVIQATTKDELAMGYTNPLSSSTGLNFLVSTLNSIDGKDLLGKKAVEGFEDFQANVPFVAYTTMQMRDAATSGVFDSMILEYQTYVNTSELSNFVFSPFGVRHDNPIYAIGNLDAETESALDMFIEFCLSEESQKSASRYGFNQLNDYVSEEPEFSGKTLLNAQSLWKEKKDSGRPVVAVFVADISGSMSGIPLNQLKTSLINGSQYINSSNYIGLISYNRNVYINWPIKPFDLNSRAYFTGAVEDLSEGGNTATFDAILLGLKMLLEQKEQMPNAKLMMFVLSDGETNSGHFLPEVEDIIRALEIPIYTIGYNANIDALKTISAINEAASINASSDDVVYALKNLFNAQM